MPASSRAMSTTPRFQPPSPEMKRATWVGRAVWWYTVTLPKGSRSKVSSVALAAAGRARESRSRVAVSGRVLFLKIDFVALIGRSLCTNRAAGRSPRRARQDPVGHRPVVLADDVLARPDQQVGEAVEMEAEAVLLLAAVGAQDLPAAELLELGQHRLAVVGGLAEPFRWVEVEIGGAGGTHQHDQRDPVRQVRRQPGDHEG